GSVQRGPPSSADLPAGPAAVPSRRTMGPVLYSLFSTSRFQPSAPERLGFEGFGPGRACLHWGVDGDLLEPIDGGNGRLRPRARGALGPSGAGARGGTSARPGPRGRNTLGADPFGRRSLLVVPGG